MLRILAGAALCGLLVSTILFTARAQPPSADDLDKQASQHAANAGQVSTTTQEWSKELKEFRIAEDNNRQLLAICVMGTAIVALLSVLAMLYKREALPETMVAGSGLVLVIFATVLVAILAKTDQQLTAPIGILGAIAGYLFGKTTKAGEAEQRQEKDR